jgi:hypothetical protein
MTLAESLTRWRQGRERLGALDAWIDAGKPLPPQSLVPLVAPYLSRNTSLAKRLLKETREESVKDAFIRMLSAFEQEFRAVFAAWLHRRCGSSELDATIARELPESIRSVVQLAAVLEPRFSSSRRGRVGNLLDFRNKLVHGAFASSVPYDLDDIHRTLSEIVGLFAN